MERLLLLHNPIQRYAWGSRTAIPALLGRPPLSESDAPWAELWMGAHTSAPSRVDVGGEQIGLDQAAEQEPESILGPRVARDFGGRLPFLFKMIAAERPLSLQCHPGPEAARAGFERENRLGVPLGAPERNYRDASHKPELVVALGRFEALVGFRPAEEISARLFAAGAGDLAELLERTDGMASFLASLLRLDPGGRRALLDRAAAELAGDKSREAEWVRRLMRDYPGDPAALSPLFLNLVELAADEALHLGAGVLHAYLSGVGLEIMASSDNVLRGGLTGKHIDVDELGAVLRAEALQPQILRPERGDDGLQIYSAPAPEFRLGFADLDAAPYERARERTGPEIVLSLAEHCRIVDVDGGGALDLERGSAALITAKVAACRVEGRGGRAYFAWVP